jgi:hypothetical protein
LVFVSVEPGSARIVTALPSMMVGMLSVMAPSTFTIDFTLSASLIVLHGTAFVQSVPDPFGRTYATWLASAQVPLPRHARDGHCECCVHSWHLSWIHSAPAQSRTPSVHCTHVPPVRFVSQIGKPVPMQSVLIEQVPPFIGSPGQPIVPGKFLQ